MPQEMGSMLAGGMAGMGMNSMVADVFANQAMNQLQNQAGMLRWFPALFMGLQQLFSVGHSFVMRKLLLLLCPFIQRKQGAPAAWAGGDCTQQQQQSSVGPDGLKVDIEEADLYIPSMAYVTYVLLYGVHRGMLKEFNPQVLSDAFSFAMVMMILEVGAFYMAFYFAGNPVPGLHLLANCGYKYLPCSLMVVSRIIVGDSNIYYLFFFYLAACAAWSIRRFMLRLEPSQLRQQYGVPASALTTHIITAMAVTQVPICWILLRGA